MKKPLISEFKTGLILGIILTFLGSFIQYRFHKEDDLRAERKKEAKLIVKRVHDRLYRARNIITSSGSDVFEARWDDYIVNAVYPWNIDRFIMDYSIENNAPALLADFNSTSMSFEDLHRTLIGIRRRQKTPNSKQLENLEHEAKRLLDKLSLEVESLVEEVMEF